MHADKKDNMYTNEKIRNTIRMKKLASKNVKKRGFRVYSSSVISQ